MAVRSLLLWSVSLLLPLHVQALMPAEKCNAEKLREAGKYAFCRTKADSKAVKTGASPDYSRCDEKFGARWIAVETGGAGMCPSNGDQLPIQSFITEHTDDLALALAGGGLPTCSTDLATCTADLGTCESDLTAAQASLTTCDGNLTSCSSDLASCNVDLGVCGGDLGSCNAALGTCETSLSVCESMGFPATGQLTAYMADKNDGIPGPVAVPDDGTVRAGKPLAYADNGDGTVTDLNTGLMWEKKTDDGGLHDKDNTYRWSSNGVTETIWDWLDDVNAEAGQGFAGHSDWRIPNIKELQSIVDFSRCDVSAAADCTDVSALDPIFGLLNSQCRVWSSTNYAPTTNVLPDAWTMNFMTGAIAASGGKSDNRCVRAVRGGF